MPGAPPSTCLLSLSVATGYLVSVLDEERRRHVRLDDVQLALEPTALLGNAELVVAGTEFLFFAGDACPITNLPPDSTLDALVPLLLQREGVATLLCFEIQHFGLLADLGGLEATSRLSRAVARALHDVLPESAGRSGGALGAFSAAVALPPDRALKLAERVRGRVRTLKLAWADKELEPSLVVGLAPVSQPLPLAVRTSRCEAAAGLRQASRGGASFDSDDPAGDASLLLSPDGLALLGVVESILSAGETAACLDSLLHLVVKQTKAERGLLFQQEPDGELVVAASLDLTEDLLSSSPALAVSRSLINEVARTQRTILVDDALRDPRYQDRESVVLSGLRSALVVPLSSGQDTIGVIYLDSGQVSARFTRVDRDLLQAFAALISGPIDRLRKAGRDRARLAPPAPAPQVSASVRRALVGENPAFLKLLERIDRYAATEAPVVLEGESGTGKEIVARALHLASGRPGAFVAESCTAIPPSLLEATLLGHERGSFSDAHEGRAGLFEQAHQGTLLLDDVDHMPPPMQAAILRVLEGGEVRRVGGVETHPAAFRLLISTQQPLTNLVKQGRLRQDLYYRFNVLGLRLPPLRERPDDIPLLVRHFIEVYGEESRGLQFSQAAMALVSACSWPGNVRQLENEVRRLLLVHGSTPVEPADLALEIRQYAGLLPSVVLGEGSTLKDMVAALERKSIVAAVEGSGGNRALAARRLGISRSLLYLKLDRYGLT
ncbi:MAG: sigma 54-interacting transcriptional regulator [Planctomycetes bacterium]|nr:sigma 54-interacting transcriptional regulator [Planctomycetota bacterium]